MATIVKLGGSEILQHVIENVKEKLSNSSITQVTKDEYFTHLTPEGELYDKSVLLK